MNLKALIPKNLVTFCIRSCSIGSHVDSSSIRPWKLPLFGSPIRCDDPVNTKPRSPEKERHQLYVAIHGNITLLLIGNLLLAKCQPIF